MSKHDEIYEYFKENNWLFTKWIKAYDSMIKPIIYDSDKWKPMEEFDEFYEGTKPSELAMDFWYGWDADNSYTDEDGQFHRAPFNINKNYFKLDGYANPVSSDFEDYSDYLDYDLVKEMIDYRLELRAKEDSQLEKLLDEYEDLDGSV
jgi:hypothetical protein